MSKHDDYLTEIAYEIDEIMYEYYTRSNHLISKRRNQEKLITYRDKSIETVNDMNVRSFEVLASLKNVDILKDRCEILIGRNEEILASSLEVISSSPLKSDFIKDVSHFASTAYSEATDALDNFAKSDTYSNLKEGAAKGYVKIKDVIANISKEPKVQEGVKVVKEISKDIIEYGEEIAQDVHKRFTESKHKEEASTPLDDQVRDFVDEVIEKVSAEEENSVVNENQENTLIEDAQRQIDQINSKHALDRE